MSSWTFATLMVVGHNMFLGLQSKSNYKGSLQAIELLIKTLPTIIKKGLNLLPMFSTFGGVWSCKDIPLSFGGPSYL